MTCTVTLTTLMKHNCDTYYIKFIGLEILSVSIYYYLVTIRCNIFEDLLVAIIGNLLFSFYYIMLFRFFVFTFPYKQAIAKFKQYDKQMRCVICLNQFNDDVSINTTILICGHRFCTLCLETYERIRKDKKCACPTCRNKYNKEFAKFDYLANKDQ
eukprot:UN00732